MLSNSPPVSRPESGFIAAGIFSRIVFHDCILYFIYDNVKRVKGKNHGEFSFIS